MKKLSEQWQTLAFIALILVVVIATNLTGCTTAEKIGDKLYTPITETNIVSTPSGDYPMVVTNGWALNPKVKSGIEIAGNVAPVPWANIASNTLLALLGIGAHFRGKWEARKILKVAESGVSAAQAFKKQLAELDAAKAKRIKDDLVLKQTADGTRSLIQSILSRI